LITLKANRHIKFLLLALIFLIQSFSFLNFINYGNAKSAQITPDMFSQSLNYNKEYIYNVTQFHGPLEWLNFNWSSVANISTNKGGQIKVNFTGFYEKDPLDIFNLFQSPIPYMDITFLEMKNSVLIINHTFCNISNGESSMNLNLGYNLFKSGFLIPIDNFSSLRMKALDQNNSFFTGDISVEESHNFISFDFRQDSGFQNTNLIYEKKSGLLVSAVTSAGNYSLQISLLNYSLNINQSFEYNVNDFGEASMWYDLTFNYIDLWQTNQNGTILIKYTGSYMKPLDFWGDVFPYDLKRAWYGIEIFFQGFSAPISIITFDNLTNREAATNLMLGFNDFQPGFFLPKIDNLTFLKNVIREESKGAIKGNITLIETNLTLYVNFTQIGGGQKTTLLYEKRTGLLLYADTEFGGYNLEITIGNYTVPDFETGKKFKPRVGIPSFSLPITLGIIITFTLVGISIILLKKNY
jgi:hypothetical protein